jgi:hypothetical protein
MDSEHAFSNRKVLTVKQIKSWLSTESGRRKRQAALSVIDKGLAKMGDKLRMGVELGGSDDEVGEVDEDDEGHGERGDEGHGERGDDRAGDE